MSKKYEFPYFQYIKNFEEFVRRNAMTKCDKLMYMGLLSFARTKSAKFFVTDNALNAFCGFSKNTFTACRKRLREYGLINYRPGRSKILATEYELIPDVVESQLAKEYSAKQEELREIVVAETVPIDVNTFGIDIGNEIGSHIKDNDNVKKRKEEEKKKKRSRYQPFEKDSRSVGDNADSPKLKRISGNQQGIPVMYVFKAVRCATVPTGATFLHENRRFEKIGVTTCIEVESGYVQEFSVETEVWVYHSTERIEAPVDQEGENDGN